MELAYDLLEDENKAACFIGMAAGRNRDRWFERKAGVEVSITRVLESDNMDDFTDV
jgi:hypothetical protein